MSPPSSTLLLRELLVFALLYVLLSFALSFLQPFSLRRRRMLPPGPRGWPVVGALPLLGAAPHVALANLARRYGSVMHLRMGSYNVVVASSPAAARAFLKTLDASFSNRPVDAGPTRLAYGAQDLVFAEYGQRWKLLRRLCNLHMLGSAALDRWAHIRREEVGRMVRSMRDLGAAGKPVTLPEMLVYATANMIGRVILGRRVFEAAGEESSEFKDMVVELMTSAGLVNVGDFVPALSWMDVQGIERGMKALHKRFDQMLTKMVAEHTAAADERKGKPDFLDFVMKNRDSSGEERLSDVNIKALLLNLFTAGTDTSSSTIEWAIAEMLNNPSILKRVQEEMDLVIGRNRRLEESDILNLPYLRAICKESFRKHPSTPLNLPRVSTEACEVNGYYIPKNTRLIVNIWAIGRDPDVWDNPLEFNPDRFMTGKAAKLEPKGTDFELIPFGGGRRICAGARMGVVLVEYILGTLVHSFDWNIPEGVKLNMDEVFGLALQKAVPVSAMVTPRLAPEAYA